MKKIVFLLLFLSLSCSIWSQKHSFSVGFSAYNYLNDGYGYKFNQFSKVFISGYNNPLGVIYKLSNFSISYSYKVNNLYAVKISNDFFVREYRKCDDFDVGELGLDSRQFSTTTLSVNRVLLSKWKSSFKLRGTLGIAFRNGDEYFHTASEFHKCQVYTVWLQDVGYTLGGEARYNVHKNVFFSTNLNFIDYVIGPKPKARVSIFNKSWTVFQANFSVGVNF
jgi:hypothetical protein